MEWEDIAIRIMAGGSTIMIGIIVGVWEGVKKSVGFINSLVNKDDVKISEKETEPMLHMDNQSQRINLNVETHEDNQYEPKIRY